MKQIPCGNPDCGERRINWDNQDEKRGTRMIEVPDDFVGKTFCSITCACVAGYFSVRSGWVKDPAKE